MIFSFWNKFIDYGSNVVFHLFGLKYITPKCINFDYLEHGLGKKILVVYIKVKYKNISNVIPQAPFQWLPSGVKGKKYTQIWNLITFWFQMDKWIKKKGKKKNNWNK